MEWRLENPDPAGNPFDLDATVTFTHAASGERRTTGLFYHGDNTWKFRFSGTRTGVWKFVTRSAAPALDDRQGTVTIVAAPKTTADQKRHFTDTTLEAGIGGPEGQGAGGHGVAFADVDDSGLPDLYISMNRDQPMPDLFFRNTGTHFVNEGIDRGLCAATDGGTHGFCFADLDNDGSYDAFRGITYAPGTVRPGGSNQLKRNDGRGRFTDVTSATLGARAEATRGVIAFDGNRNGGLDLFAVSGPWGSEDPPDERNEAYLNLGGFRFVPAASEILLTVPAGQGATDTDFDGDGDVDVLAANRTGDLHVLRNDGRGGFERVPPRSIGLVHPAKDGVSVADVNNDGHLDLLLAGDDYGELYLNQGDGRFRHHQSFRGTDGYMGGFADLNHDGHLDLVFAGDTRCYLNDGSGRLVSGPTIPVDGLEDPRAIAFADVDGDGDLDFVLAAKRSRNRLIRNDWDGGNWLKVKLISPQGQAGAFGARTRIHPAGQAGGALLGLREARSNHGYLAQDDPILHFGLGQHESVDVVVRFLDGTVVTQAHVRARQTLKVDGRKQPPPAATAPVNPRSAPPAWPRDPVRRGFLTSAEGNRWAWQTGEHGEAVPFVPQLAMARDLPAYQDPAKIDADIQTWLVDHGFNGFHVSVLCRWFDFDQVSADQIRDRDPNPDPRTFVVLERLITRVHQAGGMVHLWMWGDEDRRMTPIKWGINGRADQRLQRYLAARLGPLPGWSLGYGFDLWEWVKGDQLADWHAYVHRHLGWPHLLGGRWEKQRLTQATEVLDYSGYEQLRPSYQDYVAALEQRPTKPVLSEDRFRVREPSPYPDKDYDLDMTRRGLWHATMAGGVGNIWGYLVPSAVEGGSRPYPNREQIQTYARFFAGRFPLGMQRANHLTDGVALVSRMADGGFLLFYREAADRLRLDLSGLKAAAPAIAVDTKQPYRELDLGLLEARAQTWNAPYPSDWAIAIQPNSGGSGASE